MKKTNLIISVLAISLNLFFGGVLKAQSHYWVMLTDKEGSNFDPYSYFDSKAIERYQQTDANLYDISNYPVSDNYVSSIRAIFDDPDNAVFGESRWFNAVAVTANDEQIEAIRRLPFVKATVALCNNMQMAATTAEVNTSAPAFKEEKPKVTLTPQLVRMGGEAFRAHNIDGSGVRIAVFDAGFPEVNTHNAFKHLRDNHRIIKTWNFPNKKENVYGWNSHGTMTLSCIAGKTGTEDLGLATGAEFLLARTEVESEPFKEEVWWQMAVEWADKNGAQIISSSLGYGKDRYYTKDMNGQSYVAKAANMAARKGILVCNSAGNEGSDNHWLTIITPSDADSVLCVGGITHSLSDYDHISFSSYGPSADGRQKPNVCAFGHAYTAATGGKDDYHYVDGTSFSCPLVAGFAACALQSHPELSAMQLFHEIEKSADLYPYCDYTFGYGVPQADYFVGTKGNVEPSFRFETVDNTLRIVPILTTYSPCHIFIKNSTPEGRIVNYTKLDLPYFNNTMYINITCGRTITANYNGYTESYTLNDTANNDYMFTNLRGNIESSDWDQTTSEHFSSELEEDKGDLEYYFMLGVPIKTDASEMDNNLWSPAKRIGIRNTYYFSKSYGWGIGVEYGNNRYNFGTGTANDLETLLSYDGIVNNANKIMRRYASVNQFTAEIYQRVRLMPAGMMHKGLHWDLGAYISTANNSYRLRYSNITDPYDDIDISIKNAHYLRGERIIYGLTTRLTYDIIGIYARFNMHRLGKTLAADEVMLPRLEVGLQMAF